MHKGASLKLNFAGTMMEVNEDCPYGWVGCTLYIVEIKYNIC